MINKLINVQSELKAPKGQYNSFGKYKYRSCEDILEALKPILKKNKATLFMSDEIVLIGERYYVKATATFMDCESGTSISNTAYAREEQDKKGMDGSQITGTSSSYARKYALNGLFLIDDTKDADTDEHHNEVETKPAKLITQTEQKVLEELAQTVGAEIPKICSTYKVDELSKLTHEQFIHCKGILEKRPKKES